MLQSPGYTEAVGKSTETLEDEEEAEDGTEEFRFPHLSFRPHPPTKGVERPITLSTVVVVVVRYQLTG